MRTAYQYRLRPNSDQITLMGEWLELLRRQYNYRLGERFNWYEQNRCDVNACPHICHLPELKDNPDFYWQKRDLVNSKALFPEYGKIHSQVLQNCIERVKKTFDRWLKGPRMENTIGIDMGLKSFLMDDSGKEVEIPQYYRKSQKRLKRLQRSVSRKKKGSNRRKKAIKRVGIAHLKVSNQRQDFHYKTAHSLLQQGKHIAHEKLNIKGIARTRLAKSTHDAGWGQFLSILSIKAAKAGLLTVAVNPNGTSQDCSGCGQKVKKDLSVRWHSCSCGCQLDRDHNAAKNVKYRAVGHSVLNSLGNVLELSGSHQEASALSVLR